MKLLRSGVQQPLLSQSPYGADLLRLELKAEGWGQGSEVREGHQDLISVFASQQPEVKSAASDSQVWLQIYWFK